jgi:hypothetical protein
MPSNTLNLTAPGEVRSRGQRNNGEIRARGRPMFQRPIRQAVLRLRSEFQHALSGGCVSGSRGFLPFQRLSEGIKPSARETERPIPWV